MAFWKVAGFAQPSPIEQILDKEEYTLEELLDEDDIIQECKSLNGRLLQFLREKKTVEQLLRYLVGPVSDSDDPKKQYKYPFTACEVFCCEVEALYNTLLEDESLMKLLFSLPEQKSRLSCKAAGYFARVVGQLLLRKTNEMMQYLSHHEVILEKLTQHLDTTSIADVIKRLAGADDQASMLYLPVHTQWLTSTPLIDMLLERLGPSFSPDVQTNAADILTAIAHTQPSALATQLMQPSSITALFQRALDPAGTVLVPALEVCIALLEPRRNHQEMAPEASSPMAAAAAAAAKPRHEAVATMIQHLPQLVQHLHTEANTGEQETPYGLLAPPLGRSRLRIVELLAVLLRFGDDGVDQAIIDAGAINKCMELFVQYPFNNLLHHQMAAIIVAVLRRSSEAMVQHMFGSCDLAGWLTTVPTQVTPAARSGTDVKMPLRAGYLGHITQVANILNEAAAEKPLIADALNHNSLWHTYVIEVIQPRNDVEDVTHWACGRPSVVEGGLDSDADEFQNDMDLEQMEPNMQPTMYHRYGVLDDMDDDDDEEARGGGGTSEFTSGAYSSMIAAAMQNMDITDNSLEEGMSHVEEPGQQQQQQGPAMPGTSSWSLLSHPVNIPGERGMEEDAVLLASDDEDMTNIGAGRSPGTSPTHEANSSGTATPLDDMVIVEQPHELRCDAPAQAEAAGMYQTPASEAVAAGSASSAAPATSGTENGKQVKEYSDFEYWRAELPVNVPDDV